MHESDPYRAPEARIEAQVPAERLPIEAAGRWLRCFNLVVDYAALKCLWMLLAALYLVGSMWRGDDLVEASLRVAHVPAGWRFAYALSTIGGYYVVMEGLFGFTFGKLVTGTRVVDERGERPSSRQLLIRTAMRFVPLEPISAFGENGSEPLPWHDTVSKTRVVRRRR